MINLTTTKSRTELSLAVQTGKRRDKEQITVALMGGELEMLSSGDVQMCGTVPGSHRRRRIQDLGEHEL